MNAADRPTDTAFDRRLADRLKALRQSRDWSLDRLAAASGVSRATLSRLEHGGSSPTAEMLGRICAAFGIGVSRLIASVEAVPTPVVRAADRPVWRDGATGFERHAVSPPAATLSVEIVEAHLPAGAEIAYPDPPVPGQEHHLLLQSGHLSVTLDGVRHDLAPGDCLRYRLYGPSHFGAREAARYLLILA